MSFISWRKQFPEEHQFLAKLLPKLKSNIYDWKLCFHDFLRGYVKDPLKFNLDTQIWEDSQYLHCELQNMGALQTAQ